MPAGLERSVGIKTARYAKDASDPQWLDDPELKPFYEWMKEYVPTANPSDTFYLSGWTYSQMLVQVLRQCGDDLTRENIMRQAACLKDFRNPALLPGQPDQHQLHRLPGGQIYEVGALQRKELGEHRYLTSRPRQIVERAFRLRGEIEQADKPPRFQKPALRVALHPSYNSLPNAQISPTLPSKQKSQGGRQMPVHRMTLLAATLAVLAATPALAQKNYGPGVTDTEIKIGQTIALQRAGSPRWYDRQGWRPRISSWINSKKGGINGRKINCSSPDDGYRPPKAVENARQPGGRRTRSY